MFSDTTRIHVYCQQNYVQYFVIGRGFQIFKLLPVATSKIKVENKIMTRTSINAIKHSLVRSKSVNTMVVQ